MAIDANKEIPPTLFFSMSNTLNAHFDDTLFIGVPEQAVIAAIIPEGPPPITTTS